MWIRCNLVCHLQRKETMPPKTCAVQKHRKTETRRFWHGKTAKNDTSKPIVNACKINIFEVRAWGSAVWNRNCRWMQECFATGFCKKTLPWGKTCNFQVNHKEPNCSCRVPDLAERGRDHPKTRKTQMTHFFQKKCVKMKENQEKP